MTYTAADFSRTYDAVMEQRDLLVAHGPHADHCGGYDVAAWPCPTAAKVLAALLGGAA